MAKTLEPAQHDESVFNPEARYPGTAVTKFKGAMVITLNPTEPMGFRRLNFGLDSAEDVLRSFEKIKLFYDSHGQTCPEGCEVTDFKQKKILCLNPGQQPRRQFGLDKAGLIVSKIQSLRNFVAVYGGTDACREHGLTPPAE